MITLINIIIPPLIIAHLILLTPTTSCSNATSTGDSPPATAHLQKSTGGHSHQKQQQQQVDRRSLVAVGRPRRPESSSSMFADVEDLSDSTIRTRLGTVINSNPSPVSPGSSSSSSSNIEHLGDSPGDFDRLVERMLAGNRSQLAVAAAEQQQRQADPYSNRTSMKFFRHDKTFASIVYTNPNGNANELSEPGAKQVRRLINCHLVDLEKHSSDVALYESKYDIRTIDIEFRDMMQLIEACTNIARLRWRPGLAGGPANQSSQAGHPNAAQLFAASLPGGGGSHSGGVKPLVVVGRPLPGPSSEAAKAPNSLGAFQSVMTGALGSELRRLPAAATQDDSHKLDLPQQRHARTHPHNHSGRRSRRSRPAAHLNSASRPRSAGQPIQSIQQQHQQQPQQQQQQSAPSAPLVRPGRVAQKLLSKAIEKVGETTSAIQKKLVLGEVTAPPGARDDGSLREALQEITSYDTSDLLAIWRGILPGTNWCGMGDRASSYNDLGFESDIDICCRAHDFCPVRLSAFSAGYGLFNWSFYTRSHCWCDQNFLDCLQRAESPLSAVVMKFYFTIMKTTCLSDNESSALASQLGSKSSRHSFFSMSTSSGGPGSSTGKSNAAQSTPASSPWTPTLNRMQSMFGRASNQRPDNGADQSTVNNNKHPSALIPALKQSQPIQTKIEQQHHHHQQQQQQQQRQMRL